MLKKNSILKNYGKFFGEVYRSYYAMGQKNRTGRVKKKTCFFDTDKKRLSKAKGRSTLSH